MKRLFSIVVLASMTGCQVQTTSRPVPQPPAQNIIGTPYEALAKDWAKQNKPGYRAVVSGTSPNATYADTDAGTITRDLYRVSLFLTNTSNETEQIIYWIYFRQSDQSVFRAEEFKGSSRGRRYRYSY